MIGLLGKKVGMTQIFNEDGLQQPVTLLEVGPCYVTDIRKPEKQGYSAVQIGFDLIKEKRLSKPRLGLFKKLSVPAMRVVREIRTSETEGLEVGNALGVNNFEVGDILDVQGISIGKGFQGVVKRHHFKGGEKAHGSKIGRESGSIGQGSANPSRVPKGRRMAGHMGDEVVTVQHLKVVKVEAESNLLVVSGSVPGFEGGYLVIKASKKRGTKRKWKVLEVKGAKTPKASSSESTEGSAAKESTEATGEKKAGAESQETKS